MRLTLDHYGKENIRYTDSLEDVTSSKYQRLAEATREGLDRMVMQSDLRDIYHGVAVSGFEPAKNPDNATVKFFVQLSENTEESRLHDVMVKSLRSNNYSLGGTEVFASKENIQYLLAEDFDECADRKFHDCAEDAQCFNLRGTYTCSCKEGFTDLSQNTLFPGRVCSAEQIGCEQCSYHGTCYTRNDVEIVCECFQWYAGDHCQINLKVLLLILVLIGACLMVLLVVCLILACMKHRDHHHSGPPPLRPGVGFRRYKGHGTGDKRAMISLDTSSEGSVEHTPPPYIKQVAAITAQRQKVMRKAGKGPAPMAPLVHTHSGTMDQRDRSLTVMIPRAKYRPVPVQPTNTLLTMSTFGPEQKLINYLTPDGANTPEKHGSRSTSRKPSNSTNHSESRHRKTSSQSPAPRKPSTGALVSAGFEVSATVGRTKELDESFIAEAHTDLSQQGFNTIRTAESSIIVDIPPPPTLEAELEDVIAKVDRLTVSEARSYDETTIQPPTKSLHRDYDSTKHSSSHHANNDEGHTMVERDLGSTFMMPQTHLFKPDRGSDVSNFDSL